MEPAAIEAWSDLFVASAGASAALAGLLFVAVSINIDHVLKYSGLPDMALVTMLLLLGVLVVSLFCLIPDQSPNILGKEILVQSLVWSAAIASFAFRSLPDERGLERIFSRIVLPMFGTVPYLIGALVLMSGSESGLYWVFAGLIGAVIAAMLNAWVLLVEIRR